MKTTFLIAWIAVAACWAEPVAYLRHNHMGYPPSGRPKSILACSKSSLQGVSWKAISPAGAVALSGTLGASTAGLSIQTPFSFHHPLDFSAAKDTGVWKLVLPGADTARIVVRNDPYSFFAGEIVRYMGAVRSGRHQVASFRKPSHLGDTSCALKVPDGAPSAATWKASPDGRKLSMEGGWYDAGDYLKFTQTNAYATYFLLRSWEANPGMFEASGADVLSEAAFGLRWLLKTFPDSNTFVIEVGDQLDHDIGRRLPEADKLNGKRPAFAALAPGQMGLTEAALALGAAALQGRSGYAGLADSCRQTATGLHRRLKGRDVVRDAYYLKGSNSDFYANTSVYDDMALGAAELYRLAGDPSVLADARSWSDSADEGGWCGWGDMNLMEEARLASLHPAAAKRRISEIDDFRKFATQGGAPWGLPFKQTWAPFDGYPHVAAQAAEIAISGDSSRLPIAWDIFDYMNGRNNWGVGFLMSERIPGSVKRIYSQIFPLSGQYPSGAVAEGPGDAATHRDLVDDFEIPPGDPLEPFNSTGYVFYDNGTDYQTMETTIGVQANTLYMLAVVSRLLNGSGPSSLGPQGSGAAPLKIGVRHRPDGWMVSGLPEGPIRMEWISVNGQREVLFDGLATNGELSIPHSPRTSGEVGWIRVVSGGRSIGRIAVPRL
ncbi:MAG: glycoside hydrolase family 9 protein [Fibrobacteres bacterium]|nr:glycoside hydrolase family 9 protein [Fibrobacterota bacterium]